MKIKILVEDKKKGKIEIPLNIEEIRAMYDLGFMLDDIYETLKLNKIDKSVFSLHRKFEFLLNDVIHDGKTYSIVDARKGEKKKSKMVLNKRKWFLVKKPKWRKSEK